MNDTVRADAVFFKLWTYRSAYTSQFNRVQPAPLFLAIEPEVVRFESGANWVGGCARRRGVRAGRGGDRRGRSGGIAATDREAELASVDRQLTAKADPRRISAG